MQNYVIEHGLYKLICGGDTMDNMFEYVLPEGTVSLGWPSFLLDVGRTGAPEDWKLESETALSDRIREYVFSGYLMAGVTLRLILRTAADSPVIRFHYVLSSEVERCLVSTDGRDLIYFGYQMEEGARQTEIRLSNYDSIVHGYCLNELPAFDYEDEVMGPILAEERGPISCLTAYEHGSMYPDKFIAFARQREYLLLCSVRCNYPNGRSLKDRPYESVWLQFGAVAGDIDALAKAYRAFQLRDATMNLESRKPYIFYNTWAFQERNRFWNHKTYLSSMNQERIEQEIEIAHRIGVDVFVIDTGWYVKTGDWEVNGERFPKGIRHIADMLRERGMKLGLWFNPTVAAASSRILRDNKSAMATRKGKPVGPFPVWETEESYMMCIVSDYWEKFADRLIELADEYDVRYFKWDAVDMYGCEDPGHNHGGVDYDADELRGCYAFEVGRSMSRIVDKLCKAHPDAIVDVDITEGNRYFGLGFLSSGKFFSLNNGPYYPNYDINVPDDVWINIFVWPGPARTWIMRRNLSYDKWFPSVLMMAHYLPDDPASSQMLNLGSLILGQNGIWGDLLSLSEEGVGLFAQVLGVYKRLRDDITAAYPRVTGQPGQAFEAHEKLNEENGRGVVVLFANQRGHYEYRLHGAPAAKQTLFGEARIVRSGDQTKITADFAKPGAIIAFFED
ncbi:MAG: alpha-galactosidase [Clostridia bacterium]|nr:alpha-galactosidase [Clostridia bacterium]